MTTDAPERAALDRLTAAMDAAGKRYRLRGADHLDGQCPAHDDRQASFTADWYPSDSDARAGRVVLECHAGCDRDSIPAALGLTWRDLMDGPSALGHSPNGARHSPSRRGPSPASRRPRGPARPRPASDDGGHVCRFDYRHPEAQHVYTDADGVPVGRVDRVRCTDPACPGLAERGKAGKTFVTRHPDRRKGKPAALDGLLYRLPEVLAAVAAGRPVYLCEGEGDADAVAAAGECGTSAYGGAERPWTAAHSAALAGAVVVLGADRDPAGYRRAAAVARELARAEVPPVSVRVVQAAIDRPKADLSDHLTAGLPLSALVAVPADALGPEVPPPPPGGMPDLDAPPPPPGPATPDRWTVARADGRTFGRDDTRTYRLESHGKDAPPEWAPILDAAVVFGSERSAAPDPDFPERSDDDDPDGPEGSADVVIRMRRGGQIVERTVRAVAASRARDMKMLDMAGPSAWLGLAPTPRNRAVLFAASLALSEREGRRHDVFYAVTGHHVVGGERVFIGGANVMSARGVRRDLVVVTDSRLSAWEFPDPLPASEMTAGLAEVTALYAGPAPGADPRVMVPQLAAVVRAWLGVYRDPADASAEDETSPTPWLTGVTGHGKSGTTAAAANLAAPALRYNTLPFKAGPASHGGITGPALERVLFRGRDLCLPFDDLDPSIPPPTARAWQSDFLRRLADQKSRAVAQGRDDLRAAKPPRCLAIASGEPLDGEDSAVNRALNVPFDRDSVDLAALREVTAAERRMFRARFGAAVLAEVLADYAGARAMLARYRESRRGMFLDGREASGPVVRGASVAAELLAAYDVMLDLAKRRGADGRAVQAAREVAERAMMAAWARHLEIIGASSRSRSFVAMMREALAMGAASLDDAAEPGTPPADYLAAGWEPLRGALAADDGGADLAARYRRRGPVVGWADADGSVWLLPNAATAAARTLAERSGDHWTGTPRTIGETLKSDGALVAHGSATDAAERAAAQLPRALRALGLGARAWHIPAAAWTPPDAPPTAAPPAPPSLCDEPPDAYKGPENGLFTGSTGSAAGQSLSATGSGTGSAPVPTGSTTGSTTGSGPSAVRVPAGQSAPLDMPDRVGPKAPEGPGAADASERWPLGPILLADVTTCYLADGSDLSAPATLADLLEVAATPAMGGPRLHKAGRDYGPEVYLTPAASERYGIPAEPDPDDDTGRGLALAEDHPAVVALRAAGWRLSALRVSSRVWRPGPERASVGVTLLGWAARTDPAGLGALLADDPSPASLAARLGRLAALTRPPTWTAGVTAEAMMTELRPAERVRRDPATGDLHRTPVPGSLTGPVPPSVYDAPDGHPAARGRPPGLASRDEALDWTRPVAEWTDAERAAPWAVTVDVCAAFLAACSALPLGLDAPREMTGAELAACNADPAAFLRRRAGAFVADVAGLREQLDPRLPCPLTETGRWPDGPRTLHAPTLRYALEYPGVRVTVAAGAVHDVHGPYLDPWARRLTAAYLAALADAGITPDMDPAAFLAAYAEMRARYPDAYAVRRVVQALYKAGIGRLRHLDERARDRATWRPGMRPEVIARSRVDLHRKAARLLALTGAAPLAWATDALTYPAPEPDALAVIPRTLDGGQVPGCLRIGPRPGWVKFSHAEPMAEALARAAEGDNPAIERAPDDADDADDGGPGGGE